MATYHSTLSYLQATESEPVDDTYVDLTDLSAIADSSSTLEAEGNATAIILGTATIAASPAIKIEGDALVGISPEAAVADALITADLYSGIVTPNSDYAVSSGSSSLSVISIESVNPAVSEAVGPSIEVTADKTTVNFSGLSAKASSGAVSALVVSEPTVTYGASIVVVPGVTQTDSENIEILCGSIVYVEPGVVKTQLPLIPESVDTQGYIDVETPTLSMDAYTGGRLAANLPLLQIKGDLHAGKMANAAMKMPSLRLEAFCGNQILSIVPLFEIEMAATYNYPAGFTASMQGITMFLESEGEILASLISSIPGLYFTSESKSNNGDISCIMPSPELSVFLLSGATSALSGPVSLFRLKIQSVVEGDNDLIITLCSPQLHSRSGEIGADVLRYVKGKVR